MSIIVTQISKYGIIFGSDSNITSTELLEGERKKIFNIPKLNSSICIAGAYSVAGELMDSWLPKFIEGEAENYNCLGDFVRLLASAFEVNMTPGEKQELSISHISGYTDGHPEMWCLSNTILLESGVYSTGSANFHYSEDFWSRDWPNNHLNELFESDGLNYQIYVNSLSQGRVAFNMVRQFIDTYFVSIFSLPQFNFRYPRNIEEQELLVRTYIDIINTTYMLSDYEPKVIGGATQTHSIRHPDSHIY